MKKFLCFIFLCSISSILLAQKDDSFVPDKVRSTFNKTHPDALVSGWYKENDNYKVVFREPATQQQILVYNKNGNVVRMETQLQTNEFPPAIVQYYERHYPDKTRYEIWGSKSPDGTYVFYSPVDDNTLYFDKNGNFIKSEKPVPDVKY
jgi:hypothetical protein